MRIISKASLFGMEQQKIVGVVNAKAHRAPTIADSESSGSQRLSERFCSLSLPDQLRRRKAGAKMAEYQTALAMNDR